MSLQNLHLFKELCLRLYNYLYHPLSYPSPLHFSPGLPTKTIQTPFFVKIKNAQKAQSKHRNFFISYTHLKISFK